MNFTNEQVSQLCTNGRKIQEYLEEIQPQVEEEIVIDFGPSTSRLNAYKSLSKESTYTLCLRKDSLCVLEGGLGCYFGLKEWMKGSSGYVDIYKDRYRGSHILYFLCLNWKDIKKKIEDKLQYWRNEKEKVFSDFEV